MNLYLLERDIPEAIGYDEYDSAVVIAESENEARLIHPCGYMMWGNGMWNDTDDSYAGYNGWVSPDEVIVTLIGTANEFQPTKSVWRTKNAHVMVPTNVVCASFNAG